MPSSSKKQENFMRAEYGRAKSGEKTDSGMKLGQLKEWVHSDVAKDHKKKALKEIAKGGCHA